MAFSFLIAREKVKILQTFTNHILKKAQPVNLGHFTAMLQTCVNNSDSNSGKALVNFDFSALYSVLLL